jgi:hypothetical protein
VVVCVALSELDKVVVWEAVFVEEREVVAEAEAVTEVETE